MRYAIRKKSRWDKTFYGYEGPTCIFAGVEPGKIYMDLNEARSDVEKLTKVNPVGFDVINELCEIV